VAKPVISVSLQPIRLFLHAYRHFFIDPLQSFQYKHLHLSTISIDLTTRQSFMSEIRNKTIQGLKAGDTFVVSRQFTEADMLAFADLTRDYNPIHFDKRFVGTKNFNDRICHGLLVGSILTEVGGQIGWLASEMNFRFRRPVYFGDTIECTFTIIEIDDRNRARADVVYRNQDGVIVLEAELAGIVPGETEKGVLSVMVAEGDPTNKVRG
jgi:acyl dehydratase